MPRTDHQEHEGVITEAMGGGQYAIKLDRSSEVVRGQMSGRMRKFHIRIVPGDRVRIEVSPTDTTHGLIVRRLS